MKIRKHNCLLIQIFCTLLFNKVFCAENIIQKIPNYGKLPNNGANKCVSKRSDFNSVLQKPPTFAEVLDERRASVSSGNGLFKYSLTYRNGVPSPSEFTNMYFAIKFTPQTTFRREHYYAFYTPIGYTGFQPHSETEMNLVFSSFSADSMVVDSELCYKGADGGAGTSCSNLYTDLDHNAVYMIRIQKTGRAQYAAHLLDNSGVELIKIGEYKFNDYSKVTAVDGAWDQGFIESFVDNKWASCCDVMRAQAYIFGPFSSDFGGGVANSFTFSKYGTTCSNSEVNLDYKGFDVVVAIPGIPTKQNLASGLVSIGWLK